MQRKRKAACVTTRTLPNTEQFPCNPCKRYAFHRAACPLSWLPRSNQETSSYCETSKSFEFYTEDAKEDWAKSCDVQWPCRGDDAHSCPTGTRDFALPCPEGFAVREDGETCEAGQLRREGSSWCIAPPAYTETARCDARWNFKYFTKEMKRAFEVACQARFPCENTCEKEYTAPCPEGNATSVGLAEVRFTRANRFPISPSHCCEYSAVDACQRDWSLPCPEGTSSRKATSPQSCTRFSRPANRLERNSCPWEDASADADGRQLVGKARVFAPFLLASQALGRSFFNATTHFRVLCANPPLVKPCRNAEALRPFYRSPTKENGPLCATRRAHRGYYGGLAVGFHLIGNWKGVCSVYVDTVAHASLCTLQALLHEPEAAIPQRNMILYELFQSIVPLRYASMCTAQLEIGHEIGDLKLGCCFFMNTWENTASPASNVASFLSLSAPNVVFNSKASHKVMKKKDEFEDGTCRGNGKERRYTKRNRLAYTVSGGHQPSANGLAHIKALRHTIAKADKA
ncbi:uncharacterized protein LOC34619376 [Cyclospora cayetanensis]|uniref:Uncharacterized protein LOC34619376 n=1 Tax=Cyclospora cayetanensis TaxID=88456 RepID=A0A6P6RYJ8_9EIME|nr:uncharacterized protein LOC34619376 [Cyclospora cayetanensis]